MNQLIRREWTTEVKTATDRNGFVRFRGFYGTYRLDVGEGKERTTVELRLSRNARGPIELNIGQRTRIPTPNRPYSLADRPRSRLPPRPEWYAALVCL